MKDKYINDAIIGNGNIIAGLTSKGELQRISFPNIDYKQILDFFHVGIKLNDSAIIYLHDDINNYYNQTYLENTNILKTKILNSYFNLEINQIDYICIKKNMLVREYTLKNKNNINLNTNLLIHSELTSSVENKFSARILDNSLIQYNHDYSVAIFSNEKINSYQIHNAKENIRNAALYMEKIILGCQMILQFHIV